MTIALAEDGKQILYTSTVYLSLAIVVVFLRCLAKRNTKSRYGFDDLWMLLALLVYVAYSAVVISSELASEKD